VDGFLRLGTVICEQRSRNNPQRSRIGHRDGFQKWFEKRVKSVRKDPIEKKK
jgi:hypothetical protein